MDDPLIKFLETKGKKVKKIQIVIESKDARFMFLLEELLKRTFRKNKADVVWNKYIEYE